MKPEEKREAQRLLGDAVVKFDEIAGLLAESDFIIGEVSRLLRVPALTPDELPTVLIVDDDELVLRGLARALKAQFSVTTAPAVEDAIELLQSVTFSAVVSDMDLPDGTGIDVLRAARREQPHAIRVLHTGGELPKAAMGKRIGHLVQHIVKKPAETQQLTTIILSALDANESS